MTKADTAAPAETKEKAPAKPKIELLTQNDVAQPREGSKTRRVWDIATEISDEKKAAATLAEVREKGEAEGLNTATIQTQYNRWRKFHGLPPQGRAPKADKEEAAE